jgi:hypothetical protein
MNIYEYENILKEKINHSADDVLNYAILETIPPIADYSCAISVISEHYSKYQELRMALVASFLSSMWENYKPNKFLEIINGFLPNADSQDQAMILYLNAYDIFVRDEDSEEKARYMQLLENSIQCSENVVYAFYRLAKVSYRATAKQLMAKALSHVERVFNETDCQKIELQDSVSYESFINEHILGIWLSDENYSELKKFYKSL